MALEPIRIIQYGLGTVGSGVIQGLLKLHGVEIVGALDPDPKKVGLDVGDVVESKMQIGVSVSDDPERLLRSVKADAFTELKTAVEHISLPINLGIDVVSCAEELGNPWESEPEIATELDYLAKKHGVSVVGTGLSPGFTSDYLILAATAACRDVKKIQYFRASDSRPYLGGIVGRHFGLGLSKKLFEDGIKSGSVIGHTGFIESTRTIADRLDWSLDEIKKELVAKHSDDGRFLSTQTIVRGMVAGQAKIELIMENFIDPGLRSFDKITIDADPPVNMVIDPFIKSVPGTANVLINSIPHVINAVPGLLTPADMPLVHAYGGDVRRFVKRVTL